MNIIRKLRKQLPLLTSDSETVLPVLPLRSSILFPGEISTIQVGRKENLSMLQKIIDDNGLIVLSFAQQVSGGETSTRLSQVGVVARIKEIIPALADSQMVTLEAISRIALISIERVSPYVIAAVSELAENPGRETRIHRAMSEIMELITRLIKLDHRYSDEIMYTLEMNKSVPGKFADRLASLIHFNLTDKQEILDAIAVDDRLDVLVRLLHAEIDRISLSVQINNRVTESLERKKRENFLRQQLMEIRRELGDEFIEEDVSRQFQKQIKETPGLPRDIANRLKFEAGRLGHLSSSSNEYGISKTYLELMLSLPWNTGEIADYDLSRIEKVINREYYGATKIKEQVLEYLAVRQMSRNMENLPILCLVGPVGTGKASLVKAMARAMDRKLIRLNGTGLTIGEDIKGISRNEVGGMPGQIIEAIKRAGTFDCIVFLEDLEYVIESDDTNAVLALLEAVDPRLNCRFVDEFIGQPLDLSKTMFVLGTGYVDDFPEPFSHRLEIVEMPGYIDREKIAIVKRHILPKLHKQYGLKRSELKFTEKALSVIIRHYTMEAGIIGFYQQLEKIFRKVTRKKAAAGTCAYSITEEKLVDFLGTPYFVPEKAISKPEVGVATGLAWTGAGGDLMLIEGLKMRGTGQVIYTGSLGEVMKESVQAAHSFVRARADELGIDHNDFVNFDIHIHFPMGAIPKDGPSAGVTVCLVVASVMAERPIRNDIAMTGEVTLRGKVLSVGGIKEKVAAAFRAGIRRIILPRENDKDIKNLPREIVRKTEFILIESVDELFELALMEFTPSSYTLEKMFAEEIERAKNKNRGKKKKKTPSGTTRRVAKKKSSGG